MKRLFSFLIAAVLVVTCMVPAAFAAGTPVVSVDTVQAHRGDTVTVSVSITEATFATYGMKLNFDTSVLELVSIEQGPQTKGDFQANTIAGNPNIGKLTGVRATDYTANGVLFTAKFKVSNSATIGNTYPVTLTVDNVTKADRTGVAVTVANGGVKIVCDHSFGGWVVTTPPDCTTKGVETRTCSICGATETREVAATGHRFGGWVVTTPPNCTEKGVETRTCTKCGATETREVAATGHSYGGWRVTTPPNCTEKGVETRTCTKCGATETREVAATGHSFGEWVVTTPPTCTEKGVETRTCSACGATETREVPAGAHEYGAWVVTTKPTCTEKGVETRTCPICGATETRDVAALGHDYKLESDTATCTKDGVKTYKCTRCGDVYTEESKASGKHSFESDGSAIAWTFDADSHWHVCSDCGEIVGKEAHSFEWVIDKNATKTEAGLKHEECSVCKYKRNEGTVIPKLENADDVPATGDVAPQINLIAFALVAVIVVLGSAMYLFYKRKTAK